MLKTQFGNVGLRKPREQTELKLHGRGQGVKKVGKAWLAQEAKKSFDEYRLGVKQAMLVAATRIQLEDVVSGTDALPSGAPRTRENLREAIGKMRLNEQAMLEGSAPVPLQRLTKDSNTRKQGRHLEKHLLVKRSQKLNMNKQRFFYIDSGRLNVFKQDRPHLKPSHVYELSDVKCQYENKRTPVSEPFLQGYDDRVSIMCQERKHGAMYLYAKDPLQAKSWLRAVKMSKYVLKPSDREALAVVVGRVTATIGKKGWDALFRYAHEMIETKKLVKSLALRLKSVELNRGWNKMRLVFNEKTATDKLRKEQQAWAAHFLKEKMDRINQDAARPPKAVRYQIISQLQSKFRHFREEKIFDRAYPLGSAVRTRMQQALGGFDMGSSFRSAKFDEVMAMTLRGEAYQVFSSSPDRMQGRKSTYSEVNLPICRSTINVSDSLTMLSFTPLSKRGEAHDANILTGAYEAMAAEASEASWASFVNVDQISSVVLHTGRLMDGSDAKQELRASLCTGSWMTINGPKVSYCRKLRSRRDPNTNKLIREVVGAEDCMSLGARLSKGEKVRWLKVGVQIKGASLPKAPNAPEPKNQQQRRTYVVLTILGRQFKTEPQVNEDGKPQFSVNFEAEVALPPDDRALAALDETEVCIDAVEWDAEPNLCRTSWAGTTKLWKVLAPEGKATETESGDIYSLTQSMAENSVNRFPTIELVHAGKSKAEDLIDKSSVELEVTARIFESAEPARKSISPELLGRGPTTTLFTTHRGSWYDPKIGKSKFNADHVANFIEFKLESLALPKSDKPDANKTYRYHVEASCNGVSVASLALHRAKSSWAAIIPSDPNTIVFSGAKLYLALPPGCWSDARPMVEIFVMRCPEVEPRALNFQEFMSASNKPGPPGPSFEKVYHGIVYVDGLLVDQSKKKFAVVLGKANKQPPVTQLELSGSSAGSTDPALLLMDLSLRDRDYVRLNMASPEEGSKPATMICVGDKAMLKVEEPITYPLNEEEWKKRMYPGQWEASAGRGRPWVAPLRDPNMSHEFVYSGLDRMPNATNFKQRNIPTSYSDVVPCKFVLPRSEKQFLEEARPGTFWRIVDDIVAEGVPEEQKNKRGSNAEPVVVKKLSHLVHNVPCNVLAVYANGTCDVELYPRFLHEWETKANRSFGIPGSVVVKEHKDASSALLRDTRAGTGDASELVRRRVVMKEVPLSLLTGVQTAGFNIYDAMFANTDDIIQAHPAKSRNDFNPRDMDEDYGSNKNASKRKGGYAISPGPVPADAGVSCHYEWQLHLHVPTEEDMYHFVTTLRQCVRMDLAQQVQKMAEFKQKSGVRANKMTYHTGPTNKSDSGTLEVILVEGRHLTQTKVQKAIDFKDMFKKMTTKTDPSPFVRFKMVANVERAGASTTLTRPASSTSLELADVSGFKEGDLIAIGEKDSETQVRDIACIVSISSLVTIDTALTTKHPVGTTVTKITKGEEVLCYKGSKTQSAPSIQSANNPDWSQLDELKSSGGWSFKSPPIQPQDMSDLVFELEVVHVGLGGIEYPLGSVRVPVMKGAGNVGDEAVPVINLCNTMDPFQNLWLPLYTTAADGKRILNPSGELHVLTLWVPKNQPPSMKRLPKTARAFMQSQLRPKQLASNVRDPAYNLQLQKFGYNPNITKDGFPLTRADAMAYHTEQLLTIVPFYDCCQRQQEEQWSVWFENAVAEESIEVDEAPQKGVWPRDFYAKGSSIFDVRASYAAGPNPDKLYQLDELFNRGIPTSWRWSVWQDITCTTAVRQQEPFRPQDPSVCYRDLLKDGRAQKSDAMLQLQEDLVGAASWENSTQTSIMDMHFARLKRAQDVCIALIIFTRDKPPSGGRFNYLQDQSGESEPVGIAYCESLLVLAFTLLLPQSKLEAKMHEAQNKEKWKQAFEALSEKGEIQKDKAIQALEGFTGMKSRSDLVQELLSVKGTKGESEGLSQDDFYRFVSKYLERSKSSTLEVDQEANVFWLLYTLISSPANQLLREYFGTPPGCPRTKCAEQSHNPLNDRSGAMEDVHRLEKCVARWERDVWVHLGCLGFHLSSVFYGAFMRLFAFYLPTASVFGFWDYLFSESKHPASVDKPKRHALVDLAFGAVKACRATLLKCDSAMEARDCLVNYLESQYDPSKLVESVCETGEYLWRGHLQEKTGVRLHDMDFTKSVKNYDLYFDQFRSQNEVLRDLVRDVQLNLEIFQRSKNASTQGDKRITCRNVVTFIIPTLVNLLKNEGDNNQRYGGCFRPTVREILIDGPDVDQTMIGTLRSLFMGSIAQSHASHALAVSIPPAPGSMGEPTLLAREQWVTQVVKGLGQEWNQSNIVGRIFEAFKCVPEKERMSLNEFFLSLICCSKGTVGDKALGLFNLYSSNLDAPKMFHQKPITHHTSTVVEKVEGNQEKTQAALFRPPPADEVSKVALHFRVYTQATQYSERTSDNEGGSGELLGEVFVPTLKPFLSSSFGKDQPQNFTIWGMDTAPPPYYSGPSPPQGSAGRSRPYIGEVSMSIKWVPQNMSESASHNIGQLGIHLYSISFSPDRISAVNNKNPMVSVCTYNAQGKDVKIPGWDPQRSSGTGTNIEFQETMRKDPTGILHHKIGSGEQGWDQRTGLWKWNNTWGDQYSVEGFEFRKEACDLSKGTRSISLKACRVITQGILQRSLGIVTNRQAYLLSDQIFNRAGAAPAILDALLVKDGLEKRYRTPADLRNDEGQKGAWQDVKHQIMLTYEYQVSSHMGNVNLWPKNPATGELRVTLADLNIRDGLYSSSKVLWIRYARAGDGERGQKIIAIDGNGQLVPAEGDLSNTIELPMDIELDTKVGRQQALITKEEFVTCVLTTPILSESLRQLSTSDTSSKNVPMGTPIKLNVAIADTSGLEQDGDFYDTLHVRQAVLIEIWDWDSATKNDFLGECWLPPLGSLGPEPRMFVLPITRAGAQDGVTRPDSKKSGTKAECTGDLFIEASWTLPAEAPKSSGKSLEERAKAEEMSHTGKLSLKIVKAEGLRYADVRRSKGCDPFCVCYVRNEAVAMEKSANAKEDPNERGWRRSEATGAHDPIFRTNWKKATVNPEWNESVTVTLMTGAFEKRMKMGNGFAFTNKQAQRRKEEAATKAVADQGELQVFFADDEKKGKVGARHSVDVFLGDTIHQFKVKLSQACQQEADAQDKAIQQAKSQNADAEKISDMTQLRMHYDNIANDMSGKHAVMVFVPSQQLRKLAPQGTASAEYKRLYRIEEQDPSSWQPLDPIRTFQHYATTHGFGYPMAQRLRVCEGTDDYKKRNHRYRQFEEDRKNQSTTVQDTNTESACFGYALYTHVHDGGSTEWRPAILDRTSQGGGGGGSRLYRAQYVYAIPPRTTEDASKSRTSESSKEDVSEDQVLLAPTLPKVLGSNNLQHQEFLAKAPAMADAGTTHVEIAKKLNVELQLKYGGRAADPQAQPPPPISPGEVQHYLRTIATGLMPAPATTAVLPSRPAAEPVPTRPAVAPVAQPKAAATPAAPEKPAPGPEAPAPKKGPALSGKAAGKGPSLTGPSMGKGDKGGPSMGPSMGPGGKGKGGPGGSGPSMGFSG